jgi:hypothetical protein
MNGASSRLYSGGRLNNLECKGGRLVVKGIMPCTVRIYIFEDYLPAILGAI